jgi:hypothetical protein
LTIGKYKQATKRYREARLELPRILAAAATGSDGGDGGVRFGLEFGAKEAALKNQIANRVGLVFSW